MRCTFETEVAQQVGASAAVIYEYIRYWCARNEKSGKNEHEGDHWMYCTSADLAQHFPFMSEDQVKRNLAKLTQAGLIKKGCFNKRPFDRTAWYTIVRNRTIEGVKSRSPLCEIAPASREIAPPIPIKEHKIRTNSNINNPLTPFDDLLNSYEIIVAHPELRQTVLDYMENRKALKAPIKTERALKLNINEAVKLSGGDAETMRQIFEQSIRNGWKGVFELKETKKPAQSAGNEFDRLLEEEGYL